MLLHRSGDIFNFSNFTLGPPRSVHLCRVKFFFNMLLVTHCSDCSTGKWLATKNQLIRWILEQLRPYKHYYQALLFEKIHVSHFKVEKYSQMLSSFLFLFCFIYFYFLGGGCGLAFCEFEWNGFKQDAILKIKIKMRMVLMFAAFSSLLFREKTNWEGAISSQEKDATYLFYSKRERQISPLWILFGEKET